MKISNQQMNPLFEVSPEDAIGMLVADHKRVASLFADFKRLSDEGRDAEKASIVQQICKELTVHAQLEEELFYPAVREAIDDEDQVDEAVVEHASAKELIAQLEDANPEDDLYDAKVTVLGEQVDHHVEEEEGSMFPKARYSRLDTQELGAAMARRREELQSGGERKSSQAIPAEPRAGFSKAVRPPPASKPQASVATPPKKQPGASKPAAKKKTTKKR